MELFDRAAFATTLQLVGLRIPQQKCSAIKQRLHSHVFYRPKVRPIIPDPASEPSLPTRILILSEEVTSTALLEIPTDLRNFVLSEGALPVRHELRLGYDTLSMEQVAASYRMN